MKENEEFFCQNLLNEEELTQEKEENILKTFDEFLYSDFEKKLEEYNNKDDNEEEDQDIDDIMKEDMEIPIEQVVKDYQDGISEAFDYIYNIYYPKLERLGRRKNNDELAQELSIVLYRAASTFKIDGGAKFNTYYWRCARNHMGVLNINKNAKKRTPKNGIISMNKSVSSNENDTKVENYIEDKNSSFDYEDKDFGIMLKENIFPYLKHSEIIAVQMLIKGYTLQEIGQALGGITPPAVHVKFRRLANKKIVGKQLKQLYDNII